MGRPANNALDGDDEFEEFSEFINNSDRSYATKKSYRTSFRKLRDILGKNIADTSQETTCKAIMASTDNINSAQALLNIAVIVRQEIKKMPVNELIDQRAENKEVVTESLKQANAMTVLPDLDVFDDYINLLWQKNDYRAFIINYLIRFHYVRNQDLLFDIVFTKNETLDDLTKNYIWIDRKKQVCNYIRNTYKTSKTYGTKVTKIDNERFIVAAKKCAKLMYCFPLTDSFDKIGYYVNKLTFNNLGEGDLLKIIINHYKGDYSKIKEIAKSRGTNENVILTSYNISYNDIESK